MSLFERYSEEDGVLERGEMARRVHGIVQARSMAVTIGECGLPKAFPHPEASKCGGGRLLPASHARQEQSTLVEEFDIA